MIDFAAIRTGQSEDGTKFALELRIEGFTCAHCRDQVVQTLAEFIALLDRNNGNDAFNDPFGLLDGKTTLQ